jgi:LppX_LprAFG lipoprotein
VRWLALAAVALALTACGDVSLDPVAKAATTTVAKNTEHVTFTGNAAVGGQKIQMTGNGDFQTSPALGSMSLTLSGSGVNSTMDEVTHGTMIYLRSPLFTSNLPQGKSWLSLDLQKAAAKLGLNMSQFTQQSPTDTLQALEKAGSVTKVGTDVIDGTPTTHYRATIDLSKASNGAKLEQLTHLKTVPVDVWIDSENLLRRVSESYSMTASGQQVSTRMNMLFSNYGEPVNVTVPSATDTIDMTTLGG